MVDQIRRSELRAFFTPYVEAGRFADRVDVWLTTNPRLPRREGEWMHHGSGYCVDVCDAGVTKYTSGTNSHEFLAFNKISRVQIKDRETGDFVRELHVQGLELV